MKMLIAIFTLLISVYAFAADESQIVLKNAPGKEAVMANCVGCHSVDLPLINSPFQDKASWTKTVDKMRKVMKADISEKDREEIINYLTENYGKK